MAMAPCATERTVLLWAAGGSSHQQLSINITADDSLDGVGVVGDY